MCILKMKPSYPQRLRVWRLNYLSICDTKGPWVRIICEFQSERDRITSLLPIAHLFCKHRDSSGQERMNSASLVGFVNLAFNFWRRKVGVQSEHSF